MVTIIWREWFNETAVRQLTAMGTLPHNEIEVDDFDAEDGEVVACIIAKEANEAESENFRDGGEIVIVEPVSIAGKYDISTHYQPEFSACKSSDE